jgi:hypothetical protein
MNNVLGIGIDGLNWIDSLKKLQDLTIALMKLHPHKQLFYRRVLRAMSVIPSTFYREHLNLA